MGLYKRGDVWWMRFTVNGERQRVSTGLTSKRKAEDMYAKTRAAVVTGQYVPETARPSALICPPFEIAVESYLEHQRAKGRSLDSYRALDGYGRRDGERGKTTGAWMQALRGRRLDSIASEEIEAQLRDWQTEHAWSNSTRNNRLNQLSGLFSYAYGRRWIDFHPTEKGRVAKLPVNNERDRWLRSDEIVTLARTARTLGYRYLVPIIRFAPFTGLRRGELCGLRKHDLQHDDQGQAYLVIGKTKNGRPHHVFLEGGIRRLVERQASRCQFPADYLFPGPAGKCAYVAIGRHLQIVAEAVGIEWGNTRDGFTFHSMRHTMASLAASAGVDGDVIQKMGNWRSRVMVDRYRRFADEKMREAAVTMASITGKRTKKAHKGTVAKTRFPAKVKAS